jgi:hypothetical protein
MAFFRRNQRFAWVHNPQSASAIRIRNPHPQSAIRIRNPHSAIRYP